MNTQRYVQALRGLFSTDPEEVREANRVLYEAVMKSPDKTEADLALAQAATP